MATQSFIQNITRRGIQPRIKFIHGPHDNDYEDYVISVSRIKRDANLTVGMATVTLNNGTGTFNFWKDVDKANPQLNESAQIKVYISGSPADLFTLFGGRVQEVELVGSRAIVRIKDHVMDFLQKPLGTGRLAHLFIGKPWTPHEMVWRILIEASGAGLDDTESVNNTDINWTSFVNWRDSYLATKAYSLKAKFTSQKIRWALLKIAQMTHSYIFIDTDGKVAFAPSLGTGYNYSESNTSERKFSISMDNMITRNLVQYGYNTTADQWLGNTGYNIQVTSEAQHGRYTYDEESRVIWHHGPVDDQDGSALEDRNQIREDFAFPPRFFNITTTLAGMIEEIGNNATISDTLLGISNETIVIEEILTDLEARTVKLKARWDR
jgi:hypothetical protein